MKQVGSRSKDLSKMDKNPQDMLNISNDDS